MRYKSAALAAALAGALTAGPAIAWEVGNKMPDFSKYESMGTRSYLSPKGQLFQRTFVDGDKNYNTFSIECENDLLVFGFHDGDTGEVVLDKDVDGVADEVYKDFTTAPSPLASMPDCPEGE